jgi:hypothetical protein
MNGSRSSFSGGRSTTCAGTFASTGVTSKTWTRAKTARHLYLLAYHTTHTRGADFDLYDHALDRKVWSLSDQRMEWNKEVAMKRRTVPQQAEELVNDVLARQREADEEVQQALVIPESELAGPYGTCALVTLPPQMLMAPTQSLLRRTSLRRKRWSETLPPRPETWTR